MGAQAAYPNRTVIDIDGDGSFQMNIQELATIKVEKLPVKILLLNNQHLGMVVQWEDRFFAGNRGHTYLGLGEGEPPYPDFVTIAKGFGVKAKQISHPSELRPALEEWLDAKEPYLLDVLVPHQEHVLPMIPSGMTVRDMIKV
jgi:acetolactate synthase-1/2/3 large subunit